MSQKRNALVILPEIYGYNQFIENVKTKYQTNRMDVFCPNLWMHQPFPYEEENAAYRFFQERIGFGSYRDIDDLLEELHAAYNCVLLMGFSAGATLAWRCGALGHADGVIACYGSRIRDYTYSEPLCPVLLLFAVHDSFDVAQLHHTMQQKKLVKSIILPACHSFLDAHHLSCYAPEQAKQGWQLIDNFIDSLCQ